MSDGTVVMICVADAGAEALRAVEEARVVAGKGIAGDRYFLGSGTFSAKPGTGRQITLIEAEAMEHAAKACDVDLAYPDARRNLVTRGVALNALVGRAFRVGGVRLLGVRLCDPCRVAFPEADVKQALDNRGGLRADVLGDGVIRVGDPVSVS